MYTECTGNLIHLDSETLAPSAHTYISYDCLKLLLQTMYVDVGPELLKVGYELYYKLRNIERGYTDAEYVRSAVDDLKILAEETIAIRNRLVSGQYEEPGVISTMAWRPDWDTSASTTSGEAPLTSLMPNSKSVFALSCFLDSAMRAWPAAGSSTPESIRFIRGLKRGAGKRDDESSSRSAIEELIKLCKSQKEAAAEPEPAVRKSKSETAKKSKATAAGNKKGSRTKKK